MSRTTDEVIKIMNECGFPDSEYREICKHCDNTYFCTEYRPLKRIVYNKFLGRSEVRCSEYVPIKGHENWYSEK